MKQIQQFASFTLEESVGGKTAWTWLRLVAIQVGHEKRDYHRKMKSSDGESRKVEKLHAT